MRLAQRALVERFGRARAGDERLARLLAQWRRGELTEPDAAAAVLALLGRGA